MADFSDNFTAGSDVLLKNHSPDVGTAWVYTGTNDDGWAVRATGDLLSTAIPGLGLGNRGAGYDAISPELSSADQQVWGQQSGLGFASTAFLAVRLVNASDLIGYNLAGTGSAGRRLSKIVSGTVTDLITSQGVSAEWIRVKADGDTISFWQGGTGSEPSDPEADTNWTQIGLDQTVTDHQTEVSCGVAITTTTQSTEWLTSFRASAIGGGGEEEFIAFPHPRGMYGGMLAMNGGMH